MDSSKVSSAGENNPADKPASGTSNSDKSMDHTANGTAMTENMSDVTKQLHSSMERMMSRMMGELTTGDVDHDFAHMMVEHHEGAIDLSKILLKTGDDEKMRSMAQKVIDKQQKEISEMKEFTGKKPAQTASSQSESKMLMDSTHDTMSELQKVKMTGDADHDYAHMLKQHHQDAIEMAKVELQYGKDQKLKSMAQKMIEDQQGEIQELQNWIAEDSK